MGILALILILWGKCFNLSPLSMLLTIDVFYKVEEVSSFYRVCWEVLSWMSVELCQMHVLR